MGFRHQQDLLAEDLAPFQPGGGTGGAEDAQATLFKAVHKAVGKRDFRSHHGQPDLVAEGELK